MREFASARARAAALPLGGKLLYTAFAALFAMGLLTSLTLYGDVVGFSAAATPKELYQHLIAHYQGAAAVSGRQLLETTHAHLFTMSVCLLVMGHLLLLTNLPAVGQAWLIGLGVAGTLLHVLAPWGVRLGGAALAWLYPITAAMMLGAYVPMMGIFLWQMWRPVQR